MSTLANTNLENFLGTPSNTSGSGRPRVCLGKLDIDMYTEPALVGELVDHAMDGNYTRMVATINAQLYVVAEKSEPFRKCIRNAEYICADGMSIVFACRAFAGETVPRIAGVDLIGSLCRYGAPRGLRVFLLGGRPGTAFATAQLLKKAYPDLEIAGVLCPAFGFEKDPTTLQQTLDTIAAAKPNILFVALGAPKQELFISEHIRPLKIPIAIGIGGSFEILSGQIERAPRWMQARGLEWFYRFTKEPTRLGKRYLVGNLEFIWYIAKWRLRTMLASPLATAS